MKLWKINRILRKIGLVLTLIQESTDDGFEYSLLLERSSTYDLRVIKHEKTSI